MNQDQQLSDETHRGVSPSYAHHSLDGCPVPLHNLLVCAGYYEHWTGCDPRCPQRAWREAHMTPAAASGVSG